MQEPWGIANVDFLRLYAVGLALALLVASAARILVRAPRVPGMPALGPLDEYEAACLRGGPRLVVETAIARLVDRGHLHVRATGAVFVTCDGTGAGPVDQTVLRVASRPDAGTVSTVIDQVIGSEAVALLRHRLVRKGLLVETSRAVPLVRHALIPLALLFAVGAARWVGGVGDGHLDGSLTLALLVTAALGGVLADVRPGPTFLGARLLAEHGTRSGSPAVEQAH